jgi:hypothetical protein
MEANDIFISYRRADVPFAAGRLGDVLSHEFGDRLIFRDIDDIEAGVDFTQTLNQALASCKVLLVLMGNGWLNAAGARGRRLDDPHDWVRQEIAHALQRDVRVIPVLLEQAQMPSEADLPDDLKALCRRQAVPLSDARWQSDVAHLVAALRVSIAPTPAAADLREPGVPAVAMISRVGAQAGAWVRRLVVWGLGGVGLIVLLPVLLVYSCSGEMPDVAGLWVSDAGVPFEFTRADRDGQRHYAVQAIQPDFSRVTCDANPGMFGMLTMACTVATADVNTDRWACENLSVAEKPPRISGTCKTAHAIVPITLSLRRAGP